MNLSKGPFLSIITVVKDDIEGFKDTFKSIASQDCMDFEWVIVDGSIGNEIEIFLENTSITFPFTYVYESPRGIYPAMNLGLKNSTGEWIWFINAGDEIRGDGAISLIKVITLSETAPEVLGFGVAHIGPRDAHWHTSIPQVKETGGKGYLGAEINHQGFLATRSTINNANGFDTDMKFAADGKLMDLLVQNYKYYLSGDIISQFKIGGASSINIRETLREIDTYRPRSGNILYQMMRTAMIVLKNSIRIKIIRMSRFKSLYTIIIQVRNTLKRIIKLLNHRSTRPKAKLSKSI
jgi:putative colanic acid biosynthesis glycosyltransferase